MPQPGGRRLPDPGHCGNLLPLGRSNVGGGAGEGLEALIPAPDAAYTYTLGLVATAARLAVKRVGAARTAISKSQPTFNNSCNHPCNVPRKNLSRFRGVLGTCVGQNPSNS